MHNSEAIEQKISAVASNSLCFPTHYHGACMGQKRGNGWSLANSSFPRVDKSGWKVTLASVSAGLWNITGESGETASIHYLLQAWQWLTYIHSCSNNTRMQILTLPPKTAVRTLHFLQLPWQALHKFLLFHVYHLKLKIRKMSSIELNVCHHMH